MGLNRLDASTKRALLQPFFKDCAKQGYEFGKLDCAHFAGKAASLQLGFDIAEREGWDKFTKLDFMAEVVRHGGVEQLLEYVASKYGFIKLENPNTAQFGDLIYSPRLNSMGVMESTPLFMSAGGVSRLQLESDMIIYLVC